MRNRSALLSLSTLSGMLFQPPTVEAMDELQRLGFSEEQLAAALELVFQDRQRRPRLEDAIDLVMSGPEAPGVANRDTRVVVRELFANAKVSVLVAGYAVYQGQVCLSRPWPTEWRPCPA